MDTRTVYTTEYISLLDGTEVLARPFSIKKNRLARKLLDKIVYPVKKDEEGNDVIGEDGEPVVEELSPEEAEAIFVDVVLMLLEGQEKAKHLVADRDLLEDTLDEKTIMELIKISTGYDFLAMQKRMQTLMENIGSQSV